MAFCDNPKGTNSEIFLSKANNDEEMPQLIRTKCDYTTNSQRFQLGTKCFTRQFAHLYAVRLMEMRPKLVKAAQQRWGTDVPIRHLCDLHPDEKCIVIGTLFKDMQLRPSILKEISEEHNIIPQPLGSQFSADSDKLILEDELQRIVVQGDIDVHTIITGVVIAVCGREVEDNTGKFTVETYCFQSLPEQMPYTPPQNDTYVALVSGFEIGRKNENMFQLQLLVDLLTGQAGSSDQQSDTAQIAAVIIAGNCLSKDTQDKDALSKAKYLTKNTSAGSVEAMKSLDDFIVQLSSNLNVYIMPGEFDPANHTLPQQPLHRCMFPQAARYNTLASVTNPDECTINNVRLLGTSGQPIDDIARYSKLDDRLAILEDTLTWGHIAPTAPDSLGCYPFYDADPFIVSTCPHVYFAGNQPHYGTKLYQGDNGQSVRLVTIPKFSTSGVCVLLNLTTLDCTPLVIDTSYYDPHPPSGTE